MSREEICLRQMTRHLRQLPEELLDVILKPLKERHAAINIQKWVRGWSVRYVLKWAQNNPTPTWVRMIGHRNRVLMDWRNPRQYDNFSILKRRIQDLFSWVASFIVPTNFILTH